LVIDRGKQTIIKAGLSENRKFVAVKGHPRLSFENTSITTNKLNWYF
jgi:hypothetical protein